MQKKILSELSDKLDHLEKALNGGPGSGNFGHLGRPGEIGGSSKTGVGTEKHIDLEVFANPKAHSVGKYLDENGKLVPERAKLHKDILRSHLKKIEMKEDPTIYFTGGGSAAGKGSIAQVFPNMPNEKQGLVIDSDEIKTLIPEYNEMLKSGDSGVAAFVHEESSAIAKKLFELARNRKGDVLMDGTLAGKPDRLIKRIEDSKKTGKQVVGNFVTTDIAEALKRNFFRYQFTGRMPSPDIVIETHQGVSRNYETLAKHFNKTALVDNNGSKPRIIATSKNGKLKVTDQKAYDKFMDKLKQDGKQLKNDFVAKMPAYEREFEKKFPQISLKPRPKVDF